MNMGKEQQKSGEPVIDFVYRMVRLRDDIIAVAKSEGAVLERKMVQEQCFHALSTRIESVNIRLQLGTILKDLSVTDFQLFREVNAVVMREKECEEMQQERSTDVKSAKVKKVNTEYLNNAAIQMNARVNEMNVMKQDFNHLRQQVPSISVAGVKSSE